MRHCLLLTLGLVSTGSASPRLGSRTWLKAKLTPGKLGQVLRLHGGADVQTPFPSLNTTTSHDDKAAQIKQAVKAAVTARVEAAKSSAVNVAKAEAAERELRAALTTAKSSLSDMTHGRAAADAKVQELQQELNAVKNEIDGLKSGCDNSQAAVQALETQLADAHAHDRRQGERIEALQTELNSTQTTALRLQEALEASAASEEELKSVRAQAEAAMNTVHDLSLEVEHLKDSLKLALAEAAKDKTPQTANNTTAKAVSSEASKAVQEVDEDEPVDNVFQKAIQIAAWGPVVLLLVRRPIDFDKLFSGFTQPSRNLETTTRRQTHASFKEKVASILITSLSGAIVCMAAVGCVI